MTGRLPSLKAREVMRALERAGFVHVRSKGSHRVYQCTAPGELLAEEFMKPLGMSGSELARHLEVPANRINDIVCNRREISADTALRLARYFGPTARFWLNAQAAYNLSKAEAEDAGRIAAEVRPRAA